MTAGEPLRLQDRFVPGQASEIIFPCQLGGEFFYARAGQFGVGICRCSVVLNW
jgi:hypothetical protein